ncbi:MAG: hypothetical protein IPN95_11330 [Bacteroidetes bacterium]|nr:hypothetical protein [Bacteroidota bacterium]
MKHKYKINIDQPVPSDDKIAQHKDFGRILADYRNLTEPIYNRPLYKNPKAFMGLALILTIAFLVFWAVEKEEKDKANATVELPAEIKMAEENSFLKPPSPTLSVPSIRLKADFAKPQKVTLPDGLVLTVPANAFEGENGAPVSGEVELVVRDVSQPADLIAMGLPMQTENSMISPMLVLDVTATQAGKPLQLKPGQKISIEREVAPNFSKAQSIFALDVKDRHWTGGENASIQPIARKVGVASLPEEDGFGVVQFDENGQVLPQKQPVNAAGKEIKVMQFDISSLGIVCLGESAGDNNSLLMQKMRFTDTQDQPLRLLTLYSLPKGMNTVQFHWPKTADFVFEVGMVAGNTSQLVGFLPDGRLAIAKEVGILPESDAVHTLKMEISATPVKDLQDLTQLLSVADGQ